MLEVQPLPAKLAPLVHLALDLRWTWNHGSDALWRMVDAELWERTRNPWFILQSLSQSRIQELGRDRAFMAELKRLVAERDTYLAASTWYEADGSRLANTTVAYFSMEFGLGDAIPLYAGGLGILAGDYLKTASDLGCPVIGIGILFQQGYFRQEIDADGKQQDVYPYNDPSTMPIQPARTADGGWLRVAIELPGRKLWLRVWRACIGRTSLYLLDGNDPLNSATDRSITSRLYEWNTETRLFQEIILGIGGWGIVEGLGFQNCIAHLNEGHAAFAVIERARQFMRTNSLTFREALWATRAGNVFTSHTPVAAGFDRYAEALVDKYRGFLEGYADSVGVPLDALLALGRGDAANPHEPFNLGYLAARGSAFINAVSRRHAEVSQGIFGDLYPRWPEREIPVAYVTNGVHMPSWESAASDALWTRACGRERWLGQDARITQQIGAVDDETIWRLRSTQRADLVKFARSRQRQQLRRREVDRSLSPDHASTLDPTALTLGFARRFAAYKRPDLVLRSPERLARLLCDLSRPVQFIVAGKAHPADHIGKRMIADWIRFASRLDMRARVLFLEDYDITIAEQLVHGVDVWINSPRPPWEASGTSGMKVLVNGGLNLSQHDGWWAEAYSPDVGWAIGESRLSSSDEDDAERLYSLLEQQVVPEFYDRDASGLPRRWIARVRASMSRLTPAFSSNRMARDYLERLYLPSADLMHERMANDAKQARQLAQWERDLVSNWRRIRILSGEAESTLEGWRYAVVIDLAGIAIDAIRVELYADSFGNEGEVRSLMTPLVERGRGVNVLEFETSVKTQRPAAHFTPRIVPAHAAARIPNELPLILWEK